MRVSTIADPASGILQTGVPSRASPESMALVEARLKTWRKVRMIGSAATALACVAAGRAEAYRESGSMIWDVAAGCALVKAAGGEFHISGASLDQPLEVAAGNALVTLPD
jgi:myo-inositol-1(or 4)-monophosphatase